MSMRKKHTVYVACPMTMYETSRYEEMQALVKRLYPDSKILFPQGMFSTTAEWQERIVWVIAGVDMVIFFTDNEGYIGRGVAKEVEMAQHLQKRVERAQRIRKDVLYCDLDNGGTIYREWLFETLPKEVESWQRWRTVCTDQERIQENRKCLEQEGIQE